MDEPRSGSPDQDGASRHPILGLAGRVVSASRYFMVLAMLSLGLAFVVLIISSVIETVEAVVRAFEGGLDQKALVGTLIHQADIALLATVLYVLALGLYSLFVDDSIRMPSWLRIRSLDELKALLAGVVVVSIAVIFLGYALVWDGHENLLLLGLPCAAIIAALALFLWQGSRHQAPERSEAAERGDGPRRTPDDGGF